MKSSRRYEVISGLIPSPEALNQIGYQSCRERDEVERLSWQVTEALARGFKARYLLNSPLAMTVFAATHCFFVEGDSELVKALPESAFGCQSMSIQKDSGMHPNREY